MQTTETYLTTEDVAARMRVSRNTVLEKLGSGELPAVKFGKQWRILATEFEEYLRQNHNQAKYKK